MYASVSMADLFKVLLPRDCKNGWLAMLTAYFDDSGTHEDSDIVLVAGIIGTEGRLDGLDRVWQKHLDRPLCGRKPRLRRFHMTDCQNGLGEFTGWSRTETDYFCHQLATEIIESGVSAYGVACARKDWDDLVTGDMRAVLGNPEGQCVRNCFVKAIEWAQTNTFDPLMTFVFDNRPSATVRDAGVCFDAFQRWVSPPPELVGISFLSSYRIRPLQAADMIAWEFYQYANDLLFEGAKTPQRKQFQRIVENMEVIGQIATRGSIEQMLELWSKYDPEVLKQMAAHFTFFDPANPDYSHLSGGQSS